ncbi:hypothetical protein D1122_18760 [Cereibacter sphaeroides]|uniref:hypothetical protein n=1 Tax=Cereibacter sphaeroides TaxID=1063 RepID=UPI000E5C489B|nr:hypothetical protein [Cereibacter sphaeroides]RHZ93018.1 hypothetical protein D1122_18760 [Cereibacter sphaeroides]
MSIAALAERIAACEAARSRARRQILTLVPVLALAGAGLGFLLFGGAGTALALALAGAAFGAAGAGLSAGRRQARLAVEHPDLYPVALERYRMVMATERAGRYKLYC